MVRTTAATLALVMMGATVFQLAAAGKPGYPDKIVWGGLTWDIKTSRAVVGPGPNIFARNNVSVDTSGALHLRIAKDTSGAWTCAEIIGPASYGYGTYTFTLGSAVDALDANVVLGLFTWSDKAPYAHRELDIEVARWGNTADTTNAQYVVQPYDVVNHLRRFTVPQTATASSTHRFSWHPGQVTWESYDAYGGLIASYEYKGSDVPKPGDERVHLNLWLFNGAAPLNGSAVDVVVRSFSFAP